MNPFTEALRKLHRAAKTLDPSQARIARRNARRRVLGAMKSLRHAIDAEFPAIAKPAKPKPITLPREEKPRVETVRPRLKLPLRRGWDQREVDLFIQVALEFFEIGQVRSIYKVRAHEWTTRIVNPSGGWTCEDSACSDHQVLVQPTWGSALKWMHLIHGLAHWIAADRFDRGLAQGVPREYRTHHGLLDWQAEALGLWRRFWTELVPLNDLTLVAQHQIFLEKRGVI